MSLYFKMVSGDSKDLNITATDGAGAIIDITGVSDIKWQLFTPISGAAIISKTLGAGVTVTDAVAGEFSVSISPTDTDDLDGDYWHEVQITYSNGNIVTLKDNSALDYGVAVIVRDLIV